MIVELSKYRSKGQTHDVLKISFVYDPTLVAVVGSFEGRLFNKTDKYWTVPIIHAQQVVETLGRFQFQFTDEVVQIYRKAYKFKANVQRMKEGKFKPSEISLLENLKLPMYHYQNIGAGFMCVAESCLLGDQPGLGKTLQSIATIQLRNAKKILIFCPMSVKGTWQEEIEKWRPGSSSVIVGGTPEQRQKQWNTDVQYYICNYHLLLRDLPLMNTIPWDCIIADEATAISSPKSQTAQMIKKLKCKNRIALTGTPLSNTIEDVWSIMDWVHPGMLGTYWQFVKEYCNRDKFGSVTGYKNLNKLKSKIEPYMLRRLKKDVLTELPPKTYENIYVEFSAGERKLYESIKAEVTQELEEAGMFDQDNLGSPLVMLVRLSQMADSQELITGDSISSKLDALQELLPIILANEEKAIIFTESRRMAVILMRELEKYSPLLIAGGVSESDRENNRKMFNEDDEHRILIMTEAGSMGLNLQRATSVVHYDMPWSIAKAEQREDRAHRHGQKGNVTIYRMLVKDTVDEYRLKVLFRKRATSEAVLGDDKIDKAKKVKLTARELRSILK